MPDDVFGFKINMILISCFGRFPAQCSILQYIYFECLFGIHPVSSNKNSLFQFCFTAHYATALKCFLFYLTTSQGFPIPALLRNQMEQTMESYSSVIRQAKSVTCGLADAFPQTPSQSVPNDRQKLPQFSHCMGHCFYIFIAFSIRWTTSLHFHIARYVQCFIQ